MFWEEQSTGGFKQLLAGVQTYLQLHVEYARLSLIEKLTILLSSVILVFVLILSGMITMLYLSFALAYYLVPMVGSLSAGFAIVAGINVMVIILFVLFRRSLIVNPVVRFLVRLFLNQPNK